MQTFQLPREAVWYRQIVFSPDGRWLATSGKPLMLLDTIGKRKPAKLPLGDFRWSFAFVRGSAAIAYLPTAQTLAEYDLATGRKRIRTVAKGFPHASAADRAGERLYLSAASRGSMGGDLRVFEASNLRPRGSFGAVRRGLLGQLSLSGDGKWLACASWPSLRVWRVGGGKLPKRAAARFKTPDAGYSFALSYDGSRLAVATSRTLTLWDTATGKRVAHSGKHGRTVTAVACSPTQPLVVTGDNAGKVFLWDTTGRVLKKYDWGLGEVVSVAFDADGLRAAAADATGKVVIWDVDA